MGWGDRGGGGREGGCGGDGLVAAQQPLQSQPNDALSSLHSSRPCSCRKVVPRQPLEQLGGRGEGGGGSGAVGGADGKGGGEGEFAARAIWSKRTSPDCWTTLTPTASAVKLRSPSCSACCRCWRSRFSIEATCDDVSTGSELRLGMVASTLTVWFIPKGSKASESLRA